MLIGIGTVALIFAWPFLLALALLLVGVTMAVRLFAHALALVLSWIWPDQRDLR